MDKENVKTVFSLPEIDIDYGNQYDLMVASNWSGGEAGI